MAPHRPIHIAGCTGLALSAGSLKQLLYPTLPDQRLSFINSDYSMRQWRCQIKGVKRLALRAAYTLIYGQCHLNHYQKCQGYKRLWGYRFPITLYNLYNLFNPLPFRYTGLLEIRNHMNYNPPEGLTIKQMRRFPIMMRRHQHSSFLISHSSLLTAFMYHQLRIGDIDSCFIEGFFYFDVQFVLGFEIFRPVY